MDYEYHLLAYGASGVGLAVQSERGVPAGLRKLLSPYVEDVGIAEHLRDGEMLVRLADYSERPVRVPHGLERTELELHCGRHGWGWQLGGARYPLAIAVEGFQLAYTLEGDRAVSVYGRWDDPVFEYDAARVIRAVLEVQLLNRSVPKVHMGVLSYRGRGIGLCGRKGAGKTTFASGMMRGAPAAEFCSNDKVMLDCRGGHCIAHGMAQQVGLLPGTLSAMPGLADRAVWQVGDKRFIWEQDYAAHFRRRISPSVPLYLIVVPDLRLGDGPVRACRLSDTAITDIIERDVLRYSDASNPEWLVQYMLGEARPRVAIGARAAEALARLPWWALTGDPWQTQWDDILAVLTDAS